MNLSTEINARKQLALVLNVLKNYDLADLELDEHVQREYLGTVAYLMAIVLFNKTDLDKDDVVALREFEEEVKERADNQSG